MLPMLIIAEVEEPVFSMIQVDAKPSEEFFFRS